MLVEPGLRVIALNTNFYDAWDPYAHLLRSRDAPGGQFAWLNETLANATRDGEQVYIAAPVAPGIPSTSGRTPQKKKKGKRHSRLLEDLDVVDCFNDRFNELVQEYYPIIAGQFYGHWHRDEFKVFRDDDGNPINVAWLTSSVTPYEWVNPSVRAYSFDDASKNITDYRVYVMNLTQANLVGRMSWEFEYSPLSAYRNFTDMSPASWLALANNYLANPKNFPFYYNFHTAGCPLDTCTSKDCMLQMYCAAVRLLLFVCSLVCSFVLFMTPPLSDRDRRAQVPGVLPFLRQPDRSCRRIFSSAFLL